ncbi:hypothetical protein [Microtetraspora malaysiensis]|uniref:hypothetical protein n=1 Tax=Microtetraspora malaysiensis TaxID=161358 RepID=UPI003D92A876
MLLLGVPSWAWAAWAATAFGTFAALETIALVNRNRGDTLSENIRRWLGINPDRPVRRYTIPIFLGGLIAFVVWFGPHIIWSIW